MTIHTALLSTTALAAYASMPTTPEAVQAAKRNHGTSPFDTDPILRRSKDSAAMVPYWDLTDALIIGVEAMRAEGETYLPRFADEDDVEYGYRLKMTKMTNVYSDIVESLAAKPFEEETTLVVDDGKTVPQPVMDLTEDIDGSGNNLTTFAAQTFFNGINSAIDWIFVDHAKSDGKSRSVAQARVDGLRPYWSHVLGRNVLDVRSKVIGGVETLIYMRIFEPGEPDCVRVFVRDEGGVVRWALFKKTDGQHNIPAEWLPDVVGQSKFLIDDQGIVTIGMIPLVPFVTGRRDGAAWKFYPSMRASADLQKELYEQESGLKYARTLTAYPMLAANGIGPIMQADNKTPVKLRTGPGRVLYSKADPSSGKVGSWAYVEPSAASLKFLSEDIKDTIKELRELGRQPLTAQSGNLTVITTSVAAGKAKSAVKAWALKLKDALENAMVMTMLYMTVGAAEYDPTIAVYVEFDEFVDGKDLEALQAARAAKDISQLTYWDELRRRGVLSAEFNAEVETERLLEELPGDGEDTSDDDLPPADPDGGAGK